MKCLINIALFLLIFLGLNSLTYAKDIYVGFRIFPGTHTYVIAWSCPIDSTFNRKYDVFYDAPIRDEIKKIGKVEYHPETGMATVEITANELTTMYWGSHNDGCVIRGN